MLKEILILIGIVFLPFIELRLAIPVGILAGTIGLPYGITLTGLALNPLLVFAVSVISNIILGFLIFNFLHIFDEKLKKTKFSSYYIKLLKRGQKKIHKYVNKYGILGLILFIGLPIPGSGVYSGSFGAFVLGFEKKKFYLATVIGVIIAGIAVTTLTILGRSLF
jgi:uncharacterized membrane protein